MSSSVFDNAWKGDQTENTGAYSAIVTANPTLRDDGGLGKWSYMRVLVQKLQGGNTYYDEIGWLKGAQPESNYVPTAYRTWFPVGRDPNADPLYGWGPHPDMGWGYNYQLLPAGNGYWDFYYDDLASPISRKWLGFDSATDLGSGGETSTSRQGMGDSMNNNVQYRTLNGNWLSACMNPIRLITNDIYHVDDGSACYIWRVYGNN